MNSWKTAAVGLACLLTAACSRGEHLGAGPTPGSARRDAPTVLDEARWAWERAGRVALRAALPTAPTFREEFRLPADTVQALAWSLDLGMGQRLDLELAGRADAASAEVQVFEHMGGEIYLLKQSGEAAMTFEAPRSGRYVVRVQPSPGGGGTYQLTGHAGLTMMFPVQGGSVRSVRSVFGDPRDGGARTHNGVDIFAPRGTPVVAVTDALVEAVQNTPVGGRVIWARDETRSLTYYYAHLDEQLVEPGTRIRAGDVIGRVGNTGNAAGANPHLHFGVYLPGTQPIDPLPYLVTSTGVVPEPVSSIEATSLGRSGRTRGEAVRLRASGSDAGEIVAELAAGTELVVIGAAGEWRRVLLRDGRTGFVARRLLEID